MNPTLLFIAFGAIAVATIGIVVWRMRSDSGQDSSAQLRFTPSAGPRPAEAQPASPIKASEAVVEKAEPPKQTPPPPPKSKPKPRPEPQVKAAQPKPEPKPEPPPPPPPPPKPEPKPEPKVEVAPPPPPPPPKPEPKPEPKIEVAPPPPKPEPKPEPPPPPPPPPKPEPKPEPKVEVAPPPPPPPAPKPAPGPAVSTTAASPTAELEEADKRHKDARRLARLLVSEIKLYNENTVTQGRQSKDLYTRLKKDIDRSMEVFQQRVPEEVRSQFDYLHDELVRQLADGDAERLGANAPAPNPAR